MRQRIIAISLAAITGIAAVAAQGNKKEISRNLDIFTSIYKTLNSMYVDSIDANKSITTAINAMLNEIDPKRCRKISSPSPPASSEA